MVTSSTYMFQNSPIIRISASKQFKECYLAIGLKFRILSSLVRMAVERVDVGKTAIEGSVDVVAGAGGTIGIGPH